MRPSIDAYAGRRSPQTRCKDGVSKKSTKDILTLRVLVNSMVKACVQQNVVVDQKKSICLIDMLVEEYRHKYPALTRQVVSDGIISTRLKMSRGNQEPGGQNNMKDEECLEEIKLFKCIKIINDEMAAYEAKIEALKRRRETELQYLNLPT